MKDYLIGICIAVVLLFVVPRLISARSDYEVVAGGIILGLLAYPVYRGVTEMVNDHRKNKKG